MRDRKPWMNKGTDPILELLAEDIVANGTGIFLTLRDRSDDSPGRSTVYRALEALEEHGYIEPHPANDSYYKIADKGLEYLSESEA